MNMNISIDELRAWIAEQKRFHGWTYTELASITGYSVSGVKKALSENTLKYEAIISIVKEKNIQDLFDDKFAQKSKQVNESYTKYGVNSTEELNRIAAEVIDNEEKLLKHPVFGLWLKTKIQERIIETYEKAKNSL